MNWTKVFDQVSKIEIKSITDSLFKYGLYLLVLTTIAAILKATSWLIISLFIIAALFVVFGLGFYIYFAKKNPDYLRSESFQLRKQSIEMLGDKENQLNPNVKNVIFISSPYSKGPEEGAKKEFGE